MAEKNNIPVITPGKYDDYIEKYKKKRDEKIETRKEEKADQERTQFLETSPYASWFRAYGLLPNNDANERTGNAASPGAGIPSAMATKIAERMNSVPGTIKRTEKDLIPITEEEFKSGRPTLHATEKDLIPITEEEFKSSRNPMLRTGSASALPGLTSANTLDELWLAQMKDTLKEEEKQKDSNQGGIGRAINYISKRGALAFDRFMDELYALDTGLTSSAKAALDALSARSTKTTSGGMKLPNLNPLSGNSSKPTLQSFTPYETNTAASATDVGGKAQEAFTEAMEQYAEEDLDAARRADLDEAYKDVSGNPAVKFLGDVDETIFGQLPYVALSTVPGGQILSPALRGATSSVGAYSEARKEGASKEEARRYAGKEAVNQGAGEVLISGIAGKGSGILGKTMANTKAGRAIARAYGTMIKSPLLKTALNFTGKLGGEAGEEMLQDVFTVQNKRSTYDPDAKISGKELAYSGVLGGITAGFFNAADVPDTYRAYRGDFDTVNNLSLAAQAVKSQEEADYVKLQLDILIDECDINLGETGAPVNEINFDRRARYEYLKNGLTRIRDILTSDTQAIIDSNLYFDEAVDNAANAAPEDIVDEVANIVTTVGENTDPDEDVIRSTIDRVQSEISDINDTEADVRVMSDEELSAWFFDERFSNVFPSLADAVRNPPQNLLPAGRTKTDTVTDPKYLDAYKNYILRELAVRRGVLEQIDSVLRNQKAEVKEAVSGLLSAPDTENQTSILPETEKNGTMDTEIASNPVMMADGESLVPKRTEAVDTIPGEPIYSVVQKDFKHTKTGETLNLFQTPRSLSKGEYSELKKAMKDVGGYWSKYANGFIVPNEGLDKLTDALGKINVGITDGRTAKRASSATPDVQRAPKIDAETAVPQFEVAGDNAGPGTITAEKPEAPRFETVREADVVPVESETKVQETNETAVGNTAEENAGGTETGGTEARTAPDVSDVEVTETPEGVTKVNVEGDRKEPTDTNGARDAYDEIAGVLSVSDRTEKGDFVFSVTGKDGHYRSEIKKKPTMTAGGVPIEDARDVFWRAFRDNINREDMVDELVAVARNNKVLDSVSSTNVKASDESKQRQPVAPTPKKSVEQTEAPKAETISPSAEKVVPSTKVTNALKWILKASAKDRSIPNGYFDLDGWSAATDYNRIMLTDYDVSMLPVNTLDVSGKMDGFRRFLKIAIQNKTFSKPIHGLTSDVLKDYMKTYASGTPSRKIFPLTNKVFANPDYLKDVVDAFPDVTFYVGNTPEKFPAIYFEAEHGHGLIMPMRVVQKYDMVGPINTAERLGWTVPKHEDLMLTGEESNEPAVAPAAEEKPNKPAVDADKFESVKEATNGSKSSGNVAGDAGRTGTVDSELDVESRGGDAGRASVPVQEAEEARESETNPRGDGSVVRGVRGGETGNAGGNGDTGESIRTSEPVVSGDRNAETDERDNGEGDGRRTAERSDGGSGKRVQRLNRNNYVFDADDIEYIGKTRPRVADNIEAIRTLLKVENENRNATAEEKKVLARYKGWGGLSEVFKYTWGSQYETLSKLLTKEEIAAARASTINAHYTDLETVSAMWDGLVRMGLKGGNILEPSMGTGNFFGAMPKSVSGKANLFGVEMDSVTGRIAKALYPDASITIAPFQDAHYHDGQFDVVVGNVPFSETTYTYKGIKYTLHDYFFAKGIDHLKDGGIMMAITSTGTLDKANGRARDAIAKKADLVAAFRLPGGMFATNAGTKVTTDILVFRKRPEGVAQSNETFYSLGEIDGIPVNEYYVRHPENILGTLTREKGMYGSERTQAIPFDDADYKNILANAMKTLPSKIIGTDMTAAEVRIESNSKKSGFVEQDGKVYLRDGKTGEAQAMSGKKADMAREFMKLRDAYTGMVNISNDPTASSDQIKQARKTLNTVYDGFVKKYGAISKGGTGGAKNVLRGDADYWMVSALEQKGKNPGEFVKAPIFDTNIFTRPTVEHVDSPVDALAASIAEKGAVDLDYMAKIASMSKEEIINKLGDRIVETTDGEYLPSELYLSGNVREKLADARRSAKTEKRFEKNVRLLEAVVPKDVPTENISVNMGASWIPASYYDDFAKDVLGAFDVSIKHDEATGRWILDNGHFRYNPKYGNELPKILESTMNQKMIQVRDKESGKIDKKSTEEIQQKQRMLRDEFAAWIFAADDRKKTLGDLYNKIFNSWRGADYSALGKMLSFAGVNPSIKLRDYQKSAIARVVFGGNTILAHGVGTGKTFEMIASAMESKRIGITHKNLFVVPNNKVADFQSDILKLYPDARIMRVEKKDFEAKNRAAMIAALGTNDYDIAVIGHSQFRFIPVSSVTEKAAIQEQLDEARAVYAAEQGGKLSRSKTRSIKQIEKNIQSLEAKLKELQVKKRDDTLAFETLGIDGLFVDEAHNFKNLPFTTSLDIAGVKGGTSQRATDMYMKSHYLRSKGGRVVFATATPITNTMAEIYNMLRFVSPDTLKAAGIESFDAWASIFGEVTSALEVSPDGVHFRKKDRFAKFRNANQMIGMFRQVSDVLKTGEVIADLPVAKRINVTSEENELTRSYVQDIAERIDKLGGQATAADNMLLITNDGKAAAADLRLVAKQLDMDPADLDLPGSKINRTVENVLKEYKDTDNIRGTQLIFLNQGLTNDPEARYGFDLYSDIIKKLVAGGIKPEEIVRIDRVPLKKQAELFDKMRSGEVRVLIGTTMRMGEGLNIQDRIVALHEVMPTQKPSEIEQSEGRAIRHGNMNKEVRIYNYIQEGSFDSYLWQQLERKARFINVAMSGGDANEIDDVDEFVLSASVAKAIATGNPLLLEKAELDSKYSDLSAAYRVFKSQVYNAQSVVASYPGRIETAKKHVADLKADAETVQAHYVEQGKISINIGGTECTDRKTANEAIKKIFGNGKYAMNREYEIGSSRGMSIYYKAEPGTNTLILRGKADYTIQDARADGDNATRIVNQLAKIEDPAETVSKWSKTIAGDEKALESAKDIVTQEFSRQKEYDDVTKRLQEINAQLTAAAGVSDTEIIDEEDASLNDKSFKTAEELLEEEQEEAAEADDEEEPEEKPTNRYSRRKETAHSGLNPQDAEYMRAVESGDMDKVQRMVNEKAKSMLESGAEFTFADDTETTSYKFHRGAAPKKTLVVYKAFNVDDDGQITATYAGVNQPMPMGVWLDAVAQPYVVGADGNKYIPGKTGTAPKIAGLKSPSYYGFPEYSAWLSYRPAFHASMVPAPLQMRVNDPVTKKKTALPHNKLLFRVEISADHNYQSAAEKAGNAETERRRKYWAENAEYREAKRADDLDKARKAAEKSGKSFNEEEWLKKYDAKGDRVISNARAQLDSVPKMGYYTYKNQGEDWVLAGSFRVLGVVSEDEIRKVNAEHGIHNTGDDTMNWIGGYRPEDFGLGDYVLKEGEVPSVNDKRYRAVKLADAVTYDDDGNVIPLSQRFNTKKRDVRYSRRSSASKKWGNGNHDKKAEVRSISDLVDEARRIFGIPINTGRIGSVPKDVQSMFKEHPETIRTRRYGDLKNIAHEIGHWFDLKYDLHSSPEIKSVIDYFHDFLTDEDYSPAEYPYEAVAEYFREYLSDKEQTGQRLPEFTSWLYQTISTADAKRLAEFSDMTNAYFDADVERRAAAQVHYRTDDSSVKARAQVVAEDMKRNPGEYLGAVSRKLVRDWFDDLVDLRGFGNTYDLAYYEKQARSIAYGRLTSAFTDKNGNVVGKSLADILSEAKIDNRNARVFDEYLIARRALDQYEAAERGENVGTLVYGDEELDNADAIAERIDQYELENPSFHRAAEGVYEYERNLLDLAVNSGLMSEELRDRLNELYPHYVPLYRVMDDKNQKARGAKRGYADQNTPIARFKGSGRDIYSPIESIIQNTEKFTAACMRNDVMVEFADFLDNNEGYGWAGEKIPPKKILDYISTDELGKRLDSFTKETDKLDTMSEKQKGDLVESIMEFVGDTLSQWKPAAKQGLRVVSVMRDGARSYYEIHDEGLYKALTNMDAPQFDIVTKFFGAITRKNKFFYTTSNPQFVFTNPQRDIVTGFISSTTTDNPFRYIADFGKAFFDAVTNSDEYKAYVRSGGGYMGSVTSDYNLLKRVSRDVVKPNKSQIKKFFDTVAEVVPRLVDAGETASRLAEWKRALDQGDTNMDAMRKAQEVTVNFARGGRVVKQINQYIPFFMASFNAIGHNYNLFVNGGDGGGGRNGNNGFGLDLSPEGKARRHKAWIKWFLTTGLVALFGWLYNYLIAPKITGESEEKVKQECDNLSNHNKNAFYNLYLGDSHFLRIKKTQDMSVPATILERMAEYYVLGQKDSLNDLADYVFDNVLPVNPFNGENALDGALSILGEVSGVGTVVDLARNEDFKGTPILSSRYQYLPKTEQYKENTSNVWIAVGRALNMSPIQLQYAAEDNFGWAARLLDNLTPYNGEANLGISNKLVSDSVYSTDIVNNFYDQKDAYDKGSRAYKDNPESGRYSQEDVIGAYKYGKVADLYSKLSGFTREEGDNDISREMRKRTNALLQTVNEEGLSYIDHDVLEIAKNTGTDISDIAPYIVTPDHISSKVGKQNVSLDLNFDDMVLYYTQSRTALDTAYEYILEAGYDDNITAQLLVEARKVINKELRDAWWNELAARKIGE